jgi:hypothetical protein
MADCNLSSTHSIELLLFILLALIFYSFCFSSIRSLSHRHNLQSCHGSCLSTVQMPLGPRRRTSSKPGGAPDCRRSRQNWTVWFAKPDHLVSAVSSRGFRSPFVSCGNNNSAHENKWLIHICISMQVEFMIFVMHIEHRIPDMQTIYIIFNSHLFY